jgi:glycosyltransferase involved in cell wall biosynthesis
MNLSVLILSYNHAPYIAQAVASVLAQRDYAGPIELLILDDGSTDGTQAILQGLHMPDGVTLRLFLHEHKGVHAIAANFNFLIDAATGRYLAFLASDDFYSPHAFRDQIAAMDADPAVQLVYGNGINVRDGEQLETLHAGLVRDALASADPARVCAAITAAVPQLYIQALVARKCFFDDFAPFDEALIADDWAFNIRVFQRLRDRQLAYRYHDGITFQRRLLPGSTSNNVSVHFHRILQVARKYIPDNDPVFFTYFYVRYAKLFLRRRMLRQLANVAWRLLRLKTGATEHSRGLERLL